MGSALSALLLLAACEANHSRVALTRVDPDPSRPSPEAASEPPSPQAVPSPSPAVGTSPSVAPTLLAPRPPGVPAAQDEDLARALRDATDSGDGASRPIFPRGGVLTLVKGRELDAACTHDGGVAGGWYEFGRLACGDDGARCVVDDSGIALFRRGVRGRYLFATIDYDDDNIPEREPPRLATIIERRDRVCELFEMVRARTVRIDPRGYVRAMCPPSEEIRVHTRVLCGQTAADAAARDYAYLDSAEMICTQSSCSVIPTQQDEPSLHAQRGGDGALRVYGFADGHCEGEVAPEALLAELAAHPCNP